MTQEPTSGRPGLRTLGVEEEFHLVDVRTRRLAPRAPELLKLIPRGNIVPEFQRCVVEVNTRVVCTLDDLRRDLVEWRSQLMTGAAGLGLGIVAAGTVPLAIPAELEVTETDRFRRILAEYQLLAREQLVCGTQVHVQIASRDQGVRVAHRVAAWLPMLLALSASSPFTANGTDSGYASGRTLLLVRWPTTGLTSWTQSEEEFDREVAAMIRAGIISDEGMIYFDARATRIPTIELRICDSCPAVDTIVLIAGLFRALVDREVRRDEEGQPNVAFSPVLGRASVWRAARSGLEGGLIDLETATSRAASDLLHNLVDSLRDELTANGDWDLAKSLLEAQLVAGSSAARQRQALARRGRLTDVVDLLIAETSSRQRIAEWR